MEDYERILFLDQIGQGELAVVKPFVPSLKLACTYKQAKLLVDPGIALIESEQGLLLRGDARVGYGKLALLLGWATLEALGRRLAPSLIEKPQSPGKLVERLAGDGLITPDEADWLRNISKDRNQFIHGELNVEVSAEKIMRFVEILEALTAQTELLAGQPAPSTQKSLFRREIDSEFFGKPTQKFLADYVITMG